MGNTSLMRYEQQTRFEAIPGAPSSDETIELQLHTRKIIWYFNIATSNSFVYLQNISNF